MNIKSLEIPDDLTITVAPGVITLASGGKTATIDLGPDGRAFPDGQAVPWVAWVKAYLRPALDALA